jgi:hypothetical protein
MINFKNLVEIYNHYKKIYFKAESGALVDDTLSSDLIGQYHYGSFILAAVLVGNYQGDKKQLDEVRIVLSYLTKHLENNIVRASIDFNIESICLAHWRCECSELRHIIENELRVYAKYLNDDIKAYASDYYLLRYFNVQYINSRLGGEIPISKAVSIVVNKLKNSDDVLFDSYTSDGTGVPDLIYHCRNMQILQLCVTVLNEVQFLGCVERGLNFMSNIASTDLELGGYGRSPETIYGYASLLVTLAPWTIVGGNLNYESLLIKITSSFFSEKFQDIKITPGSIENNNKRCGFDTYTYPVVYKYYSLSKLMLALDIRSHGKLIEYDTQKHSDCFYSKSSGFLKFKNEKLELCLNVRGHYDSLLRPHDSRYQACVPFLLDYKNKFSVPQIPFTSYVKLPVESLFRKLARYLLNRLFDSSPRHLGFHPVFIHGNNSAVIKINDVVQINKNLVVAKSSELEWKSNRKFLPKRQLKSIDKIDFNVESHFSFYKNTFDIIYKLTEPCDVEYSIRINQFDSFYFYGKYIYVNGLKIVSLNIPIDKIISVEVFKCAGGFAKVVVFLLSRMTRNLSVKF